MRKAHAVDRRPFNTNNAWGFGGGIGTVIEYSNGYWLKTGMAYYRHQKSESFTKYYAAPKEGCWPPGGKQISAKDFYEVCEHE